MRNPTVERTLAAAGACLGLCAALAGWSLWLALRVDAAPPGDLRASEVRLVPLEPPAAADPAYLVVALESAPFHPQRRVPERRFRLPGEADLGAPEAPVAYAGDLRPAAASLRLIGTMILPGGRSVALVQWAGETSRLVHVGETVGEMTLRTIREGSAEFTAADGSSLQVDVRKPGS